MKQNDDEKAWDRRGFLQCMAWVGTGAMWTLASGVLKGMPIEQAARGAMGHGAGMGGLRFVQISDSHIGFDKPANTDVTATLRAAVAKIKAAPEQPSFVLHTGDLTHLSKPSEFDTLQQVLSELSLPVFYVPGEHDVLEDDGKSYLQRFGKGTQGAGWHSFDQGGVHFIGLVNVVNLKAGGLGTLGKEQLEWLEKDVKRLKSSTPIVVFAHIPLWSVYPGVGLGHRRQRAGALVPEAIRIGVGAERPHPSGHAEGGGPRLVPHRHVDRVPATGARLGALAGTDEGGSGSVEEGARPVADVVSRRQSSDRDHRRAARRGHENSRRRSKQVVVDHFSFAPAMAAVPAGTTVTWTNRDDVPHNIVSTDQKFKSPVLDTDEQFSHTFDAPGTYKYFCSIHPKMTGQVVVA